MATQPQDVLRDVEKIQSLENSLGTLRAQAQKDQLALSELSSQLEKTRSERYANWLVYALGTLLLLAERLEQQVSKAGAPYDVGRRDIDGLSLLSEALNFDFARKGMDEPFTTAELAGMNGMIAMRDRVLDLSPTPNPTVRDFLQITQRGKPIARLIPEPGQAPGAVDWSISAASKRKRPAAPVLTAEEASALIHESSSQW